LRATLLQLLYSIRSERQLVERIAFDLVFRWFVGLSIDAKVFDASTFSQNRDRLLTQEIAQGFLASLLALPEVKGLLERGAFFRRRDFAQGLGVDEELSPEGRLGRAAAGPQRRGGLAQDEALERDARLDDGSGRASVSRRAMDRRAVLPISATP